MVRVRDGVRVRVRVGFRLWLRARVGGKEEMFHISDFL